MRLLELETATPEMRLKGDYSVGCAGHMYRVQYDTSPTIASTQQ